MKRRYFSLLLLLAALVAQAQVDFKLYFANNVDEITSLRNIKEANSGLNWQDVGNGSITYSNVNDVNLVKQMFSKGIVAALSALISFGAAATDYYVGGENASDDNAGTSAEREHPALLQSRQGEYWSTVISY